jgi:hypothetical protein
MGGDIGAGAEPDVVEAAHVFEEFDQPLAAAGAADEAVSERCVNRLREVPTARLARSHKNRNQHFAKGGCPGQAPAGTCA